MCGVDIFIVFFDRERQKFTEFNSDLSFDSKVVEYLLEDTNRLQFTSKKYTNADYLSFCNDHYKQDNKESGDEAPMMLDPSNLSDLTERLQKYIIPEKQSKLAQTRYHKQLGHNVKKATDYDAQNIQFLKNASESLENTLNLFDIFHKDFII